MLVRFNKILADRDREKGFTLIELLVVIIVIGILAAIAIPAFLNQRTKGYDAAAKSDLKNYSLANEAFFTNDARYPMIPSELTEGGFTRSQDVDMALFLINNANGAPVGYYAAAKHKQSGNTWALSSLNGAAPVKLAPGQTQPGGTGGPTWAQMGITDDMELDSLMNLGL